MSPEKGPLCDSENGVPKQTRDGWKTTTIHPQVGERLIMTSALRPSTSTHLSRHPDAHPCDRHGPGRPHPRRAGRVVRSRLYVSFSKVHECRAWCEIVF